LQLDWLAQGIGPARYRSFCSIGILSPGFVYARFQTLGRLGFGSMIYRLQLLAGNENRHLALEKPRSGAERPTASSENHRVETLSQLAGRCHSQLH
jgi:hypothetical protein